jgi:hypothetical protein
MYLQSINSDEHLPQKVPLQIIFVKMATFCFGVYKVNYSMLQAVLLYTLVSLADLLKDISEQNYETLSRIRYTSSDVSPNVCSWMSLGICVPWTICIPVRTIPYRGRD